MRRISADQIFTMTSPPLPNGVITLDDDGTILDISTANDGDAEHYSGSICPGFVNTHCHLELSHMKGKIREKAGMNGFVKEILSIRPSFSPEEISKGIEAAEAEMIRNGIVAVGDISNDNSTFAQKAKGNIFYHTFIEAFDLDPARTKATFETALDLERQQENLRLSSSIVPHAPYTVTNELFGLIAAHARQKNAILSMHNQESKGENDLFLSGSGSMFESFSRMGIDMRNFPVTEQNALRTTLPKLPAAQRLLLVHNTFTSREDIQWAKAQRSGLFWCTCPNANLYIEDTLPDYRAFIAENVKVTVGTDSLASNWSLSVLDELKTISRHYAEIPLEVLLGWATKNGAEFLGLDQLGTIAKGKRPGLNLITGLREQSITSDTEVIRLA